MDLASLRKPSRDNSMPLYSQIDLWHLPADAPGERGCGLQRPGGVPDVLVRRQGALESGLPAKHQHEAHQSAGGQDPGEHDGGAGRTPTGRGTVRVGPPALRAPPPRGQQ